MKLFCKNVYVFFIIFVNLRMQQTELTQLSTYFAKVSQFNRHCIDFQIGLRNILRFNSKTNSKINFKLVNSAIILTI